MKMSESRNISTLFSFDTEYSADSVEWCPHKPNQNVFVCACYHVKEKQTWDEPRKRVGRIFLFSITPERGLTLHQTVNTAAVLDQKWCHYKVAGISLLGVVNALKKIEVYKLNNDIQIELLSFYELQGNESEILILSLDWSTGIYKSDEPEIVCSDSKGNIHLLKLICNNLILLNSWHGHGFEAWITAFYYWDTNVFFSGGDDSILLKFDRRIGKQAVAINNKSHKAGVTSLQSNCSKENIIVSGSYDENIRLWDIRNMKSEIDSIKMPGTLWRLKWDPFSQYYLLAACMLNGVHIVDVKNINEMKIIGSYYEHKNISYGADWSYLKSDYCKRFDTNTSHVIATCSFYDHLLCISKFTY